MRSSLLKTEIYKNDMGKYKQLNNFESWNNYSSILFLLKSK